MAGGDYTHRECVTCHKVKSTTGFRAGRKMCQSCRYMQRYYKNPDKFRNVQKRWRSVNGERYRAGALKRRLKKYGISAEQYHNMLTTQEGRCAVCRDAGNLVIDHCHKSSKVRGLLCPACNMGIGHLRDSPDIILNAFNYLRGGQ